MLKLVNRISDLLEGISDLLRAILKHLKKEKDPILPVAAADTAQLQRMLDIGDVLKLLAFSESKYYRLVKQGKLTPRRLGKRHYYYLSDLHEQLEESKRKGRI